ncbi:MAG: hypothetical protein B6I22_08015 [Desulfobacteraceae bacterium 4572_123]|nr:MAG: hypothetical protein B6I22_08015 [Desulfobacteraceae bacterium 4572_123]
MLSYLAPNVSRAGGIESAVVLSMHEYRFNGMDDEYSANSGTKNKKSIAFHFRREYKPIALKIIKQKEFKMTIKTNNYTDYRFFEVGYPTHSAVRKCPYCNHRLPECDCGYGLLELEKNLQPSRKGIKWLMAFFNSLGRNMFGAKRYQSILLHR